MAMVSDSRPCCRLWPHQAAQAVSARWNRRDPSGRAGWGGGLCRGFGVYIARAGGPAGPMVQVDLVGSENQPCSHSASNRPSFVAIPQHWPMSPPRKEGGRPQKKLSGPRPEAPTALGIILVQGCRPWGRYPVRGARRDVSCIVSWQVSDELTGPAVDDRICAASSRRAGAIAGSGRGRACMSPDHQTAGCPAFRGGAG
ncbi:hypothetical protein EV663_11724 [Rhodovulum bhavnagarense]|uniref:Uncharacterized protein n=1 Tax=Rhodovulum bhavnagarense TaxID=992286 RepID=A0A4R2R9K7_9RHOB|nr:hypothetical protein EV663_11724 [Rhodovulum bhavnagarense]